MPLPLSKPLAKRTDSCVQVSPFLFDSWGQLVHMPRFSRNWMVQVEIFAEALSHTKTRGSPCISLNQAMSAYQCSWSSGICSGDEWQYHSAAAIPVDLQVIKTLNRSSRSSSWAEWQISLDHDKREVVKEGIQEYTMHWFDQDRHLFVSVPSISNLPSGHIKKTDDGLKRTLGGTEYCWGKVTQFGNIADPHWKLTWYDSQHQVHEEHHEGPSCKVCPYHPNSEVHNYQCQWPSYTHSVLPQWCWAKWC